jgi:hypothetical protein
MLTTAVCHCKVDACIYTKYISMHGNLCNAFIEKCYMYQSELLLTLDKFILFIKLSGFELTTWCQKPTQSVIASTEHGIIPNSPSTAKCGAVLLLFDKDEFNNVWKNLNHLVKIA